MPKFIAKNTKKNQLKVAKRLESTHISIRVPGAFGQEMSAADALMLGNSLFTDNRSYQKSLDIAEQLLPLFSDIVDIPLLKLRSLIKLESLISAESCSRELLLQAPTNIGVLAASAELQMILGNSKQAINLLRKAVKLNPKAIDLLIKLGNCYHQIGEVEKSISAFQRVLELRSDLSANNSDQWLEALLGLAPHNGWQPAQKKAAEKFLASNLVSKMLRARLAFSFAADARSRGQIKEDAGYLNMANALLLEDEREQHFGERWTIRDWQNQASNISGHFSTDISSSVSNYRSTITETPIFILGMPRSGTTLLEQMLGGHSKVGQAGESKALVLGLAQAYRNKFGVYSFRDYPSNIDKFSKADFDGIANFYIMHQKLLTNESIYVDKELTNFMYVGLTANLFPSAKYIHINREPMDIFLSCYRGDILGIPATCDIEYLAYYYIEMKKLIGLWKRKFPDRLYVVDYASLVKEPEKNMRDVIKFLQLDWDSDILNFYKRKNVVRTLSVGQVRKAIYTSSVGKWRAYEGVLAPAIKILGDNGVALSGCKYL